MRNIFIGHYNPTAAEFSDLWNEALVVPDANVLLNFYRYSEPTRNRLLQLLRKMRDRLWLPHQAGLEFQRNRLNLITDQAVAYEQLRAELNVFVTRVESAYSRHFSIDTAAIVAALRTAQKQIVQSLDDAKMKAPDLLKRDSVREAITDLFEDKVGSEYPPDKRDIVFRDADQRYAKQVPPGYSDAKTKTGNERFGDYMLWRQILDHAETAKRPIILVTDDAKDDWWP